jgi:hypothetical protein
MKTNHTETKTKWAIDQSHSEISFKVRHLMIAHVRGSFKTFDASIYTYAKDFRTAEVDLWIDTSSITTGDEERDKHLRSHDFLDVKNHKQIMNYVKRKNDNREHWSQKSGTDSDSLPGYPACPEGEDIYEKDREEEEINPEDILKTKETTEKYKTGESREMESDDEFSGDDLDIPGAELDDDMEKIGSEDEENNYYSLGENDQDNPEEDQGE